MKKTVKKLFLVFVVTIFALQMSTSVFAWNIAIVDNDDIQGHSNWSYNAVGGYDVGWTHIYSDNHYYGDARISSTGQHPYVGEWCWYRWVFFTPFEKDDTIYLDNFTVYLWDAAFTDPEVVYTGKDQQFTLYPVNQRYAYAGWNALVSSPISLWCMWDFRAEAADVVESGLSGYNVGADAIYIELR